MLRSTRKTEERPMIVPLAALPLAVQLFVTVTDGVPTFNVTSSCHAAAAVPGAAENRMQTCLQSEQRARDEIVQAWSKATPAARTRCTQTASVGGSPTYTELITCLEMARESKEPTPAQTLAPLVPPTTSGMAHRQPRLAQPPASQW
jgi:acyl-CoA synthetase (AMP-forming)/AMP-acid ligase II